jgi:TolB-like protein/DNA-binding winged helix-turn-helix (wHTH) protein
MSKAMDSSSKELNSGANPCIYEFNGFQLDPLQYQLRHSADGRPVHLTGRALEALVLLVQHHGELVTKAILMQTLWPQVVVEENNLTQTIYALRQVLGEKPGEHRYIATVPGRGYRFVADVKEIARSAVTHDAAPPAVPVPPMAASTPTGTRRVWRSRPVLLGGTFLLVLALGYVIWQQMSSSNSGSQQTRAATASGRDSIAVLPFANLTGDASKEYWGDGMAEELISTLSKIPGMKVPARSSVFAYKGRDVDVRQIARDLGVSTVLEGSVRSAGDRLRINVQLSDATTGYRMWSESYDRDMSDLFKLQDDLAIAVEDALQITLAGGTAVSLTQHPRTRDIEAYQLTLQGFALLDRGLTDQSGASTASIAMDLFQRAVQRDPTYARAYAGLAGVHMGSAWTGPSWRASYIASERAARQALVLDPESAVAESILAALSTAQDDVVTAEAHYRHAVALDPNDAMNRISYANMLFGLGHLRDGLKQAQIAYAMAPANTFVVFGLAAIHAMLGHESDALRFIDIDKRLGGPEVFAAMPRAELAVHAGRYAEYSQYLEAAYPPGARRADVAAALELTRLVYGALEHHGDLAASLGARARLYPRGVTFDNPQSPGLCGESARAYVLLGAIDMAYDLQSQCVRETPAGISKSNAEFNPWSPDARAFRQDRRFQAYLASLGCMPYFEKYGPPDQCDLKGGKLTCR